MNKSTYFKTLTIAAALTLGALLFNSCSKDPAPTPEISYLNITNASPTLNSYNIYVGSAKVNPAALGFTSVVPYGQYVPGTSAIKLTTGSSTESVFTKNVNLEANTVQSLFVIGKGATIDYLVIKDQLGSLTSDKAFVRFINLSPDAAALNLTIKDGNTIVTDKAYKASSEFVEIEAKAYVLQIKDKASGADKGLTFNLDAKAGKSYTVMAAGMLSPASDTEQAFKGHVINNQ
ncbi:DUF4397 domain-containing protein [Pedobacter africanus]|uniref:DUF4397 domain-containing protein n=1 Tax=Pedobacter africanus TaxID=151894 RepID=A0A1W2CML6_9SPHI|nr:DUF4397 domain-containing protein [Pedobacter africanus]SMC86487.1 protein of unknown function [Pedobacter africanus]